MNRNFKISRKRHRSRNKKYVVNVSACFTGLKKYDFLSLYRVSTKNPKNVNNILIDTIAGA